MAEQEQTTSTEQSSSTEQQPASLEAVYQRFNVEAEAREFKPSQTQQTQQTQSASPAATAAVPDPVLDPTGYKAWVSQQSEFTKQALSSVDAKLNALVEHQVRTREVAAIRDAVQKFKSVVGDEVDDDMAEAMLAVKAKKDPKFLAVYNKREQNPAAWSAALSAYGNEMKQKTSFRVDSQIAENVRAAKNSIGSQTTRKDNTPPPEERQFLDNNGQPLTGAQFDRAWRDYIDRGY